MIHASILRNNEMRKIIGVGFQASIEVFLTLPPVVKHGDLELGVVRVPRMVLRASGESQTME
jgi:hypothetical protein